MAAVSDVSRLSRRKAKILPSDALATTTHYVAPGLETRVRPEKGGFGLFATQTIEAEELLVMWGGSIMAGERLDELSPIARRHSIQVEENLFLAPYGLPEAGDYVNHSCAPNVGLLGQSALVTMRRILVGEEICYDYAMSDGSPYDEFACSCRAPECRGRVTGNDWLLPQLQARYSGFFSPYIARRIERAHEQQKRQGLVRRRSRLVEVQR